MAAANLKRVAKTALILLVISQKGARPRLSQALASSTPSNRNNLTFINAGTKAGLHDIK